MWRHHPLKTSFLQLFGEFFSLKQGICDRIFSFQKLFRQKIKSLIVTLSIIVEMRRGGQSADSIELVMPGLHVISIDDGEHQL